MKLLTFDSSQEENESNFLNPGIVVKPCMSVTRHPARNMVQNMRPDNDLCILLGDGNESTGRLLLGRDNLPEVIGDKRGKIVYQADVLFGLKGSFLVQEKDSQNNYIFVLFKKIERIIEPDFFCKDDYLKIILPNQNISFFNSFQEQFIIENRLKRVSTQIKIDLDGNKFLIYN